MRVGDADTPAPGGSSNPDRAVVHTGKARAGSLSLRRPSGKVPAGCRMAAARPTSRPASAKARTRGRSRTCRAVNTAATSMAVAGTSSHAAWESRTCRPFTARRAAASVPQHGPPIPLPTPTRSRTVSVPGGGSRRSRELCPVPPAPRTHSAHHHGDRHPAHLDVVPVSRAARISRALGPLDAVPRAHRPARRARPSPTTRPRRRARGSRPGSNVRGGWETGRSSCRLPTGRR